MDHLATIKVSVWYGLWASFSCVMIPLIFLGEANSLPALTPPQLVKLKHLSIISLASKCQVSVFVETYFLSLFLPPSLPPPSSLPLPSPSFLSPSSYLPPSSFLPFPPSFPPSSPSSPLLFPSSLPPLPPSLPSLPPSFLPSFLQTIPYSTLLTELDIQDLRILEVSIEREREREGGEGGGGERGGRERGGGREGREREIQITVMSTA